MPKEKTLFAVAAGLRLAGLAYTFGSKDKIPTSSTLEPFDKIVMWDNDVRQHVHLYRKTSNIKTS